MFLLSTPMTSSTTVSTGRKVGPQTALFACAANAAHSVSMTLIRRCMHLVRRAARAGRAAGCCSWALAWAVNPAPPKCARERSTHPGFAPRQPHRALGMGPALQARYVKMLEDKITRLEAELLEKDRALKALLVLVSRKAPPELLVSR